MDDATGQAIDILTGAGLHRCLDASVPTFCCCPLGECVDHQHSRNSLEWIADADSTLGGTYWWIRRFPSGREERDGPYVSLRDAYVERYGMDGP